MTEHRAGGLVDEARVVLIVVDNPAHRVLFNRYLQESPHHRVFATDGEDGFDRFNETRPHLVLAHVNATRLDGTLLCQLIRQQPRGADVPVVLMGEELLGAEDAAARVAAVGADAHLGLPCTSEQLLACIAPLLAEGRPAVVPQESLQERPPVVIGAVGQPTELTFGSMLDDFMSQTDEASSTVEESPPAEAETGPGAGASSAPRPPSPAPDMDTVVSFKNPFFEADPPTSLEIQQVPTDPAAAPGVAMIQPPLGQDEPPTPVGHDAPSRDLPQVRVSSDLAGEQPVTELAKSPSGSLPAVGQPTETVPAFADPPPPAPEPVPVEPVAPPVEPQLQPPPRPDPLEEPKISGGGGSGVRPMPRDSGKSGLIREVPRESTPSDDNRVSQVKRAGGRRGLDESQLGKRLAKRVRTMRRLLDEVDYYQLLGLERGATPDELRRAYFDLSLEFHPDRFFLLRSGDLKEKIYEIYRRIAEAYRVLSDERKRQAYDEARSLSSAKRAAPELRGDSAAPGEAETPPEGPPAAFAAMADTDAGGRFVDLARLAYERGDMNAARLHLVFAQAHERDNATLQEALQVVVRRVSPSL